MIEIRLAEQTDTEALLAYVQERLPELNVGEGEFRVKTWADEYNEIGRFAASRNSLMAVAVENGIILGTCTLTGDGLRHGEERKAREHIAILGITVHPYHRGQGLGKKLLQFAVEQAKRNTVIRRIEADNYEDSPRARWFLINNGFMSEGIARNGIQKGGKFLDVWRLSRLI
jgi:RimJ/RimL family protein N-acetyltransferase